MTNSNAYEVVWPRGKRVKTGARLAKRLDTLEGKVVCELWDWIFRGNQIFAVIEQELAKRYPGVNSQARGSSAQPTGGMKKEVIAALPEKLKKSVRCRNMRRRVLRGLHARSRGQVSGRESGNSPGPVVCDGFVVQGQLTAAGLGLPEPPVCSPSRACRHGHCRPGAKECLRVLQVQVSKV